MTELEAIKARHSVRAYQEKPIEAGALAKLNEMVGECNRRGNLHLQVLPDSGGLFSNPFCMVSGLSRAPAAVACVGPDDETLDERVGYWGERLVLFAQTLGLNTCWVGMCSKGRSHADIRPGEKMLLAIALGYGKDDGKPRSSKTPEQVSRAEGEAPEWFRLGVEAALLAPTAMNQQKFFFTLKGDGTVLSKAGKGICSKLDLGIVRYHFDVAAAAAGRPAGAWH